MLWIKGLEHSANWSKVVAPSGAPPEELYEPRKGVFRRGFCKMYASLGCGALSAKCTAGPNVLGYIYIYVYVYVYVFVFFFFSFFPFFLFSFFPWPWHLTLEKLPLLKPPFLAPVFSACWGCRSSQTPIFSVGGETIGIFRVFAWGGPNCEMLKVRPTGDRL